MSFAQLQHKIHLLRPLSREGAMRKRRLLLAACFLALAGLWLGVVWWIRSTTAITLKNAERLRVGMTQAEVEAILGGPARNEASGPILATNSQGYEDLIRFDRWEN